MPAAEYCNKPEHNEGFFLNWNEEISLDNITKDFSPDVTEVVNVGIQLYELEKKFISQNP